MEENKLMQFVKNSLENYGAIVDQQNEDLLEGLLPYDLAQKLGFREDQIFGFSSTYQEDPQVEYISYNSEVLERFSSLIEEAGLFTSVVAPPRLYLKQKGLEKVVAEKISFLNAKTRLLKREELYNSYLLFNFKYSAISEEREDGILSVIINEHTLSSPSFSNMISANFSDEFKSISSTREIQTEILDSKPIEQTFRQAKRVAEKQVIERLVDFQKSLTRRMRRDIERLTEYYQTISQQIEQKIEKKQLTAEERAKELSRLEATHLELKRKSLDQQKRYSLDIEVDLINVMRLFIPVIGLLYELQRKQTVRNFTFIWNPLIKDLELPVCESCFEESGGFSLCDQRLHLLCPRCSEFKCPACQKHLCPACYPSKCPRCDKVY